MGQHILLWRRHYFLYIPKYPILLGNTLMSTTYDTKQRLTDKSTKQKQNPLPPTTLEDQDKNSKLKHEFIGGLKQIIQESMRELHEWTSWLEVCM